MKSPLRLAALILVCSAASSCRAIQIQKLEDRVDKLEARQAATEARVEALQRK
jgi:hypothetical protein